MLSDVDVTTLVHYMVLTSTKDKFGLDLDDLDIYALFLLFKDDLDVDLSYFKRYDLDQRLLLGIAQFVFVQKYKTAYKFMFADNIIKLVCE